MTCALMSFAYPQQTEANTNTLCQNQVFASINELMHVSSDDGHITTQVDDCMNTRMIKILVNAYGVLPKKSRQEECNN